MPPESRVTIVCALPSEAAPIAVRFALTRIGDEPFQVYEGGDTRLVISGLGAALSAAAVGFMAERGTRADGDIWVNCGIAGHRYLDCGTPVLADKVSSATSADTWYPSLLFEAPCTTREVQTFAQPVTAYPAESCCDMEAAGFMAAATVVTQSELVHVLKFVSDNARSGLAHINRGFIRELMTDKAAYLLALLERLRGITAQLPQRHDDRALESMLERWHFTYAQTAQLRRLYARHRALAAGADDFAHGIETCANAAQVLRQIETRIDTLPLRVA